MINIISPINQLGYGITGLNICKSLSQITDVSLWPIGQPTVTNEEDARCITELISMSKMPVFEAPQIKIWHQHDMSSFAGHGLRIGFPIFELDTFNDLEKHHLGSLDRIFVCSQWAKDVCLSNIDFDENRIDVIPLGVDSDIFKYVEKEHTDKTIFFNCGKWEVRKGHDILYKAFEEAFTEEDNVELWMMCDNPFYSESEQSEWIGLYNRSNLSKKIKFIGRKETQQEVYNIMSQTDCGVFPSRGEGWNLELLEMMSCGKQVIATDYSAHTEFCNTDNSLLVQIKNKELAYDGKWFHGKCGNWAEIGDEEISSIALAMREVHKNKKKNQAGIETAHQYTWENAARKILEVINNV